MQGKHGSLLSLKEEVIYVIGREADTLRRPFETFRDALVSEYQPQGQKDDWLIINIDLAERVKKPLIGLRETFTLEPNHFERFVWWGLVQRLDTANRYRVSNNFRFEAERGGVPPHFLTIAKFFMAERAFEMGEAGADQKLLLYEASELIGFKLKKQHLTQLGRHRNMPHTPLRLMNGKAYAREFSETTTAFTPPAAAAKPKPKTRVRTQRRRTIDKFDIARVLENIFRKNEWDPEEFREALRILESSLE